MEVFRKDISEIKEFSKYGDTFRQIRNNPDTGWWLYERTNAEYGTRHFEVVKGKKYVNPDGTIVYVYPCENDWGTYGYTIPQCWWADQTINFLMGRKTTSAQELYEFKKTLKKPVSSQTMSEIRQF